MQKPKKRIIALLYLLISAVLIQQILYPRWLRYEAEELSEPFNQVIRERIAKGETEFLLEEINPEPWECACAHEQYRTVKQSLSTCLGENPASRIVVSQGNFEAKEGENGIIFLKGTHARVIIPDPHVWDFDVWPCMSRETAKVSIRESFDGSHYLAISGEK